LGKIIVWAAVVTAIVYLWTPLAIDVVMSLEPGNILRFPTTGVSLRWFWVFFSNATFRSCMIVTFSLATIAAVLAVLLAVPCSMAFVRYSFPGKGAISSLFTAPLATPAVVLGVALLFFFMITIGLSFTSLVIGHLLLTFPYATRTITATMFGFDTSLEEASASLGANTIQTFRRITVPIIAPGIVASFIFGAAVSMDDVGTAAFLVTPETMTLNVQLLAYMRWALDPTVAAASVFLIIIGVALTLIADRIVGLERFLF